MWALSLEIQDGSLLADRSPRQYRGGGRQAARNGSLYLLLSL